MPTRTKRSKLDFGQFIFERVPPKATDLEEVVLGALMLEKNAYSEIQSIIRTPRVFFLEQNQLIFSAIVRCHERYQACDIALVTNELRRTGELEKAGGAYGVTMLTNRVASGANIRAHSGVLYEKFIARELLRCSIEIVQKAYEDTEDAFVTLEQAEEILGAVRNEIAAMKNVDFVKQLHDTMKGIQEAATKEAIGIPTGLENVDAITGGRVKGELTLIAARPSMGKTARMIQEAMNIALGQGEKVGIISMEMTHRQIIERMLSNMTEIDSQKIRSGKLSETEWERMVTASGRLGTTNFFLNDIANLTVTEIRSIIRRWVEVEGVGVAYVDYLGLVKYQNQNGKPVDEISKISRGLKTIAAECDIPVVALAQLNREVERRSDKRPSQSDLRDSGSLEQDADVVSFLFRPEYYGMLHDAAGESLAGVCEENIAKNRNGAIGRVNHLYRKEINQFTPFRYGQGYIVPSVPGSTQNQGGEGSWES